MSSIEIGEIFRRHSPLSAFLYDLSENLETTMGWIGENEVNKMRILEEKKVIF